jgi:uncharacterized protein YggE
MNKKTMLFTLIAILAVSLSACASGAAPGSGDAGVRSISVNGTGKIALSPDMAVVSVGIQTQAEDAQAAVDENNTIVAEITAAMAELGIAEEDLKTTNFSVYPNTRYDEAGGIGDISYMVNNSVEVTVRDLEIIGDVLAEAVAAGANNIHGIHFDVSDREEAYAQAMELAVENARVRAEVLAGAGEVEIKDVYTISSYIGGGMVFGGSRNMSFDMVESAASVPVSPGEMEIVVDVTVVYEIK